MKAIAALTLHFVAPAVFSRRFSERDRTIIPRVPSGWLAAGLVATPWASALRPIGSGRCSVRLAAVACGLISVATAQAGSFDVEIKLIASDAAPADHFGGSVAIQGTTAIVGAPSAGAGAARGGSTYLFDVTTGMQLARLTARDAAHGDGFGHSVGISGNTAIVGAYRDDPAGTESGAAYLFAPEPSSLLLGAMACLGLLVWRKNRRES